jgi:hypothetical protein
VVQWLSLVTLYAGTSTLLTRTLQLHVLQGSSHKAHAVGSVLQVFHTSVTTYVYSVACCSGQACCTSDPPSPHTPYVPHIFMFTDPA